MSVYLRQHQPSISGDFYRAILPKKINQLQLAFMIIESNQSNLSGWLHIAELTQNLSEKAVLYGCKACSKLSLEICLISQKMYTNVENFTNTEKNKLNNLLDDLKMIEQANVQNQGLNQDRDLAFFNNESSFLQNAINQHAIITLTDADGIIMYANNKFCEISGYKIDEIMGQNHRLLKSGLHSEDFYQDLWDTISSGKVWQGEITNQKKNGELYDVSTTIVPELDNHGIPQKYLSIRTDITETKKLQRKVAQQSDKLSLALMATDSLMWEWKIETKNEFLNSSSVLEKKRKRDTWLNRVHPDDLDKVFIELNKHIESNEPTFTSEHRVKNGRGGWDLVEANGKISQRNNAGTATYMIGTSQVINDRKALEIKQHKLQGQLLQAEKMESIGHLTAGIAHDFNNMLGTILGYSDLGLSLIKQNKNLHKLEKYLEMILSSGNRAKELITQMLVFSRLRNFSENGPPPIIEVQPVIKEVAQLLSSSIPSTIQVNFEFEGEKLKTKIEPVQLHQLIFNLTINARDSIAKYGQIDIQVSQQKLSSNCNSCHSPIKGEYVSISVNDTGSGIPSNLLSNIFEPFFTTKEVGKGTGMGLSVVHGIVHSLKGHITVSNGADCGTSFSIHLPIEKSSISQQQQKERCDSEKSILNTSDSAPLVGLLIMIVDDETSITNMLGELLSMYGAQVLTHTQPMEALDCFERDPQKFDLVITDEIMPELSGVDMAKAMLEIRPSLPVLLCSGHNEDIDSSTALENGLTGFMSKPIDIPDLLTWIHKQTTRLPSFIR